MPERSVSAGWWRAPGGPGLATDLIGRVLLPLLALIGVWGALLWGPWGSVVAFFAAFHAMRYSERRFGSARPLPPERLRRSARVLAHPEDIHVLVFILLYWAGLASAFAIFLAPSFDSRTTIAAQGFVWPPHSGWDGLAA